MVDYEFKIGDRVVTVYGETGEIVYICTCDRCKARGFCEPTWKDSNGDTHYITNYDAECGFVGFHKIGKYRFNDFDKSGVLGEIASYEKELRKLRTQLKTIEELELNDKPACRNCVYCMTDNYICTLPSHQGDFVQPYTRCDEYKRKDDA